MATRVLPHTSDGTVAVVPLQEDPLLNGLVHLGQLYSATGSSRADMS